MGATQAIVSIGDEEVLNVQVSPSLSDVWIDRDLSWLDFNDRVLAEAVDERTPLLERAKFLAIFTANLDEFFMKRIAVLRETLTPERLKLLEQIRDKTAAHAAPAGRVFSWQHRAGVGTARDPSAPLGRFDGGPKAGGRRLF